MAFYILILFERILGYFAFRGYFRDIIKQLVAVVIVIRKLSYLDM
jgi:hypothetical protein